MAKHKNQPTDEPKPEDVVTEEVADQPTDEAKPGGLILNAKESVDPLGMGARTQVPVFLKKMWGRNIPGIAVGSCIGYAVLPDGVDLNLFIDAIRNGVAGEA